MAELFAPQSPQDVTHLIAQYPLAWIIGSDFKATPLPLLAENDSAGNVVALIGHFARRNPQVAALQANVMDRVIAGKITPQEADVISDTAERRMRSLKRVLSAH